MKKIKLNLGCGWRFFGDDWIHIDDGNYQHLDYKTDITKLPMFEDGSVDLIYASHVIAYFDRVEIVDVLKEWNRVLKVNGVLRLATPDFEVISELYHKNSDFNVESLVGPLYGKMEMDNNNIYHKTTYDFTSLSGVLKTCGFNDVVRYNWRETEHVEYDDHSQAYIPHMDKENGTLISLNVECKKK